ncbi:MAG: hypothetical protein ACD_11C00054G0023 [uncultured bacterium]|nr:MAG: hypothetical protein ACD_11C00054G0023 [uncultured bacterium]
MSKKIKSFFWLITVSIITLPSLALAGLDWGIGIDKDGKMSLGVGSEGSGAGFGAGTGGRSGGIFSLNNTYGLPEGSILGIISNLLTWLLAIFGMAGIIGFVISGIMYLTAAGDSGQIDKAKSTMMNSIIGIIVGLSGFIALQAIASWLGGRNTF